MSAEDSTGSAPVLRTEHLGRKVEGQTIVEDASVEAWHGEVLVIVGPSGSGKSSFLRLLNLRSLGIVWIPGLMAGMILAGSDPVYAAIYQFVVIAMIFASSGVTSVVSTLLVRPHAFSEDEQLVLRPSPHES